jgi:hypothetical protein
VIAIARFLSANALSQSLHRRRRHVAFTVARLRPRELSFVTGPQLHYY